MSARLAFWRRGPSRRRVLALADLAQDAEVLLPVLHALRHRDDIELRIVASRWLRRDHPTTEQRLRQAGFGVRWIARKDLIADHPSVLRGVDVLLTAAESAHPAHAAGHALAQAARASGILTCTLQHGLENVGLFGDRGVGFASDLMFTWHPPRLTSTLSMEVQARLVHVGRPSTVPPPRVAPTHDIGVFENLHADAYAEQDRSAFREGLQALADIGASVLIKPHPAGRWSSATTLRPQPRQTLVGADLRAVDVIAQVRRVITTPSTVALDAALMDRPVALAVRSTPLLRDFPVLKRPSEWAVFAEGEDGQAELRRTFLERVLLPGDGAVRIAERIARGSVGEKL